MSAVLRAGSAPWLLVHELRLAWRGVGGKSPWILGIIGALLWLVLHAGVFVVMSEMPPGSLPASADIAGGALTWFVVTLMLSQAILLSVSALFDRGDLDLLLSSPLSARTVFLMRGLGIAANCVALYMALLTPFAHVGLFTGRARLMAIYPGLAALALGVTALGMLLTLTLVRLLGARRARTVAQLIGALAGATLFLLSQAQTLLSPIARLRLMLLLKHWSIEGGPMSADSALWLPFRAMQGDGQSLLTLMAVGAGGFWLVVALTHHRFLAGTQEAVDGSAQAGVVRRAGSTRFQAGLWRNVLVKEWRLIARDPQLITQSLMQMLYLVPLVFVVFRRHDMIAAVVPGAVMLASTLAGSLAWITVAAEDAPELLGSAPVSLTRVRWMKVTAALLPVWLLVSPLWLYLLAHDARSAGVFSLCMAGGTAALGVTQVWYPRQGKRGDMRRRMQGAKLLGLLENVCAMGWAGTAFCLLAEPRFTPVALLPALLAPAAAWRLGRRRREQGV